MAVSAGVSVGFYNNRVEAIVEGGVIDAYNELKVDASITYPFLINPTFKDMFLQEDLGDNFKPSNIGALLDTKLGLQGIELLNDSPPGLARLDWVMVFTAIAVAIASGMIAGLYPAWRVCQIPPAAQLKTQ